MSTVRCIHQYICRIGATILALLGSALCEATPDPLANPNNEAFYHQLLKLPESVGYSPTRSFTIVTDPEHGDRLVAEDDPNLRFNLLWMEQFRPGYQSRNGGAALGEVFRSYVKTAYRAYRARNAQSTNALPDENGSMRGKSNYSGEMDYNIKLTTDELRFKVQYSF
jgi:hypothetical protein